MENKFDREKHVYRNDAVSEILKDTVRSRHELKNKAKRVQRHFTVIGFWDDTMQRFADSFRASTPDEAEEMCFRQHEGVSVCGVIEGKHNCLDSHAYVRCE